MNKSLVLNKEEVSDLRAEILQSQKARIDLLQFKLIAIATLGSFSLGFLEKSGATKNYDMLLCIIPFICVYVDLLCYHNTLRILVIGQFLNYKEDPYEKYLGMLGEKNSHHKKKTGYYFELEDFSLQGSSIMLSVLLALYGYVFYLLHGVKSHDTGYLFLLIGIAGVVCTFYYKNVFEKHKNNLFYTAGELAKSTSSVGNE